MAFSRASLKRPILLAGTGWRTLERRLVRDVKDGVSGALYEGGGGFSIMLCAIDEGVANGRFSVGCN